MIELVFALALASETPQPGFSAEALAAQAPVQAPHIDSAMTARVEALREGFILNPEEALAALDPMEQRAIMRALGRFDAASAISISWFFRAAIVHAGPGGRYVGFYNPLVDTWLVTRMAYADGAWRVADAALADGVGLRASGAQYWADASADALASLAANHYETLRAFDARFGAGAALGARSQRAFTSLAERTSAWMDALGAWRMGPGNAEAGELVRQAIARGRVARMAPEGGVWRGREIDGLPQRVRVTLAITAAAPRGDGHTLFLVSPYAPDVLIILDIRGAEPVNLSVVNLANAAQTGVAP
jgi:hypothetical protein